jgi:hypothetical protein
LHAVRDGRVRPAVIHVVAVHYHHTSQWTSNFIINAGHRGSRPRWAPG